MVTGSNPVERTILSLAIGSDLKFCVRGPSNPALSALGGLSAQTNNKATLAQLVEQQFCKLWVVGSIPTGGSL
jgi:hypothetical protein